MTPTTRSDVTEDRQSLWAVILPPTIWTVYFLLSYMAAAVWCGDAGRYTSLGSVGAAFAAITVAALIGIAVAGWRGWQRYSHGDAVPSHHKDTPEDRHRFLGLATVLLAALSGIATVYVALAVAIVRSCS